MDKVYPKPVDRRLELREAVEASLARAPVVLLQPIGGDLLRVCERQPLRPIVDALALGPSRLAQAAASGRRVGQSVAAIRKGWISLLIGVLASGDNSKSWHITSRFAPSSFADQSCKATDLFPTSRWGTFKPLRVWQTSVKSHGFRAASGSKVSMLARCIPQSTRLRELPPLGLWTGPRGSWTNA